MFQVVVAKTVVFEGTFCQCEKIAWQNPGSAIRRGGAVAYRATAEEVLAARVEKALVADGVDPLSASFAARGAAYDAVSLGTWDWAIDIACAGLMDDTRL